MSMSNVAKAIEALEMKLARNPGSAADLHELAGLKLSSGDSEGAIAAYSSCLTFAPQNPGAHNNLGVALLKAGRFRDAIASLETALALQPGYLRALVNLAKALRELGLSFDAIARLREALAIQPDYIPALINFGDACAAIGDLGAAQQALERAAYLAPTQVEAHMTLGIVRLQAGRIDESLESLRTAVGLAPDHADAHSNLAHALFFSGDWPASWPHFEHRFRRHAHRAELRPPAGARRWDGVVASEIELWLLGEQGLGDQLQFARYAKLLSACGQRCVIACDPRLVKILALAELGARIVPLDPAPAAPGARWIPLMSLPAWHGTRPGTVPAADGYLAADPQRIANWRARLPAGPNLRVALAWAGNPTMETGRYAGRSPPLAALAPVTKVPRVSFSSSGGRSGGSLLVVSDARARLALDAAGRHHAVVRLDAPVPAARTRRLGKRVRRSCRCARAEEIIRGERDLWFQRVTKLSHQPSTLPGLM
jgi:tetratricopeptide (TPR) repeat protein